MEFGFKPSSLAQRFQSISKRKWIAVWVNGKKHAGTIVGGGGAVLMEELVLYGEFWKKEKSN